MTRTSPRRKIVLLLLAALLLAPWALGAAPHTPRPTAAHVSGGPALLGHLWGLLTALWNETGCHIDPGGGCTQAPAAPADEGCHIDPSGCAKAESVPPAAVDHVDEGCHIDPDGCTK
jgi:hypothetical protein